MNIVNTIGQQSNRLTISIPSYIYNNLTNNVPKGQVSNFIAGAIEQALFNSDKDPINAFFEMRNKLPKISKKDIKRSIEKGRL